MDPKLVAQHWEWYFKPQHDIMQAKSQYQDSCIDQVLQQIAAQSTESIQYALQQLRAETSEQVCV
jgi:hypothetical protein